MTTSAFHGLFVLDKPSGMTSRDVVNRTQQWFPRRTKLGHTGTLDPLATGVLVLCVGTATRLAEYVQRMEKEYRTTVDLRRSSDTEDLGGSVVEHFHFPEPHPDRGAVESCLREFIGEIEQVPPAYSAAKVAGQRAYDLARQGEDFSLAPRRVRIYEIELLDYAYPILKMRVRCGKGTYIRSLARDLGKRLGRAGLVVDLRRTRVGSFTEAEAFRLDISADTARAGLLPVAAAVADLPRLELAMEEVARLRQGQAARLPPSSSSLVDQEEVAIFDSSGALTAVGQVDRRTKSVRPLKVLA